MYEPNPEHVSGNFEWDVPPSCQCGMLKNCFDDRLIFASNTTHGAYNRCYMVVLNDKGEEREIVIQRCPWCGDEIKVTKGMSTEGAIDATRGVQ
jgi:hypothetical protein